MTAGHVVYHIPVCPFSQRLEILLALRGQEGAVEFRTVDISKPREPALLAMTRGTTALPVLLVPDGTVLKESRVILRYLDETLDGPRLRRSDPVQHAVESMLVALEGAITMAGYLFVMNQKRACRAEYAETLLSIYRDINGFLRDFSRSGPWLFDDFGYAEAVFAPVFKRFWFLEYYEGFTLPHGPDYDRVRVWQDACMAHPATNQVTHEQIVKLYYDYALGAGNGALVDGRKISSFVFTPHWQDRPWPPRDKYAGTASDAALGLVTDGPGTGGEQMADRSSSSTPDAACTSA
ncbi:glutathione S-transferase family protein [Roseinatronobacter alkalisoli]|uniref:Glutathione S-transferase family protein n=1 Tax=Roseinatronobacter alkalisoli TaxID=3028235 RepID=A0ABT5T7K4_9RHOB|nr:glutathione S-transferase family protein [Roseinatronobacter sp. HJB301]MDD7970670.1 glutathione S-transferase family protein [Roseinatronobacter sp. HJB301]